MIRTWFSIGAAFSWLLMSVVRGGEPAVEPGYVLLRDLAVLRGTVEEEPGRVIVRFQGSEVRLSREKVACWAESLDGLYQYQLDRRRVFTVESHLETARWCLRHGLCERAAAEIQAAKRIRPDAVAILRAEAELQLTIEQQAAARGAGAPSAAGAPESLATGTEGKEPPQAAVPKAAVPQAEGGSHSLDGLGPEELREFNLRIQPLLANRCSATACHGGGAATGWVLSDERVVGRRPRAAMTRENLAAVLPWINREHPAASPLLVRALKPHGGAEEPPLGPRDQEAIENLRRWIESLPRDEESADRSLSPLASGQTQDASPGAPGGSTVGMMGSQPGQPVRLPDVADPFDPQLFNRRFHPEAR
ncbi:hypothetical protein [Candidatus Laterigemmans baculatus]|uniref:hypothetical protein n=1 Tax=Candidatus Laterigemmans baculatus TaxID=2770505 RepID=UPI0013DD3946|nr:hypothetical protein [Candidatus Laterigemmans baculatus]